MDVTSIADDLFETKRNITALSKEVSALTTHKMELEESLIEKLHEIGLDQIRTDMATFSLSTSIVPVAKDWDAIHAYVVEHNATQLLQRRLSSTAYRDMVEMEDEEIPGIESFEKITVNTRKR